MKTLLSWLRQLRIAVWVLIHHHEEENVRFVLPIQIIFRSPRIDIPYSAMCDWEKAHGIDDDSDIPF